jgi:hypothetical protein
MIYSIFIVTRRLLIVVVMVLLARDCEAYQNRALTQQGLPGGFVQLPPFNRIFLRSISLNPNHQDGLLVGKMLFSPSTFERKNERYDRGDKENV